MPEARYLVLDSKWKFMGKYVESRLHLGFTMRSRVTEYGVAEGCNAVGSLLFVGDLLLTVIAFIKSKDPPHCLVFI